MSKKTLRQELIRLLRVNARMPESEMADRLRVSVETVQQTIAEMEQEGIIMGYGTLVNEEKLDGTSVRAIIEVEVQPERDGGFDRVARLISRFSEVKAVYLVSGRYDLRLEVVGESLQEVASFVASKLAPLQGIKSSDSHFLLKKYKEAGFKLHEEEEYERLPIVP